MRCKHCQYRLWNLPGRSCPECGNAFSVSQYTFIPNKVEFCCPQCQQPYYGTDARGLPTPAVFTCVKCGQAVELERMLVRPAPNVRDEETEPMTHPWRDRRDQAEASAHQSGSPWLMRRMAIIGAWMRTVGWSAFKPVKLGNAAKPGDPTRDAFAFLMWTLLVVLIPMLGLGVLMMLPMLVAAATTGGTAGLGAWQLVFISGITLVPTLLLLLGSCLWSLVAHGLLRLTGKTAGGLGKTAGAIWYGVGPMALMAIPCCGCYAAVPMSVWWAVSATLILWRSQRVSGSRAALAVVAPVLVALVVGIVSATYAFSALGNAMARMAGVPMPATMPGSTMSAATLTMPNTPVGMVGAAIQTYANQNGAMPDHAGELLALGLINAHQLTSPGSTTAKANVMIGGTPLPQFERLPQANQVATAKTTAAALPPNLVAHRLGDLVFTYHGLPASGPGAAGLWAVVVWPDPDVNPPNLDTGFVQAGRFDGMAELIPTADFPRAFATQNTLRAAHGLPPLPHPATVTHRQPATATTKPAASQPAAPAADTPTPAPPPPSPSPAPSPRTRPRLPDLD